MRVTSPLRPERPLAADDPAGSAERTERTGLRRRLLQARCFTLCCAASLLLAACARTDASRTGAVNAKKVAQLERRIAADSTDREALRDLGVLYVKARRFSDASPYLSKAYALHGGDAQTNLFYGLSLEAAGDSAGALRVYERYGEVAPTSPYRYRLEGRYKLLARDMTARQVRMQLAQENPAYTVTPGAVAIFPFTYHGNDERYAALGRGLAEMIVVDLSQIGGLRLVERVRLQALLDELRLANTGAFDPATAPQQGRLIGAERMVGGSYNVLAGKNLEVEVAAFRDVEPLSGFERHADALRNLFELQNDIVFELIETLNVQPTPEEREAIERVPTRNIQAFLAYSRGLLEEDAGRFGQAIGHYSEALSLDPGFTQAAEQAAAADGAIQAGGSPADVASIPPPADGGLTALVSGRQATLGASIGAISIPGEEARTPSSETENAGGGPLPDPPRPR